MALKTRNKVSTEFSMSSMTDIVFLLLIFFMLTSTMIAPNAFKVLAPQTSDQLAKSDKDDAIKVEIKQINTNSFSITLDKKSVSAANFEQVLRQTIGNRTDEPAVIVRFEKSVPLEQVVNIMTIAKNNGCKPVLAPPKI